MAGADSTRIEIAGSPPHWLESRICPLFAAEDGMYRELDGHAAGIAKPTAHPL